MITSFVKKYYLQIGICLFGVAVYLFLRLTNILQLPIFTDEAIYVRWSQISKQDASWRFISLTDGKQPMFVWIAMIFLRFFHDPLLAGRMVSVGSGLATCVGLFFLAREIFKNTWIGIFSALLYVLYPFGLVYDRMALYDSLVGACVVWSLFVEVLLVRRLKAYLAFIVGLVVGFGCLTKSNAFFNIYLLPFTLLLFDLHREKRKERLIKWIFLAILSTVLVYLYYSVLRLSPYFGIISEKNYTFIYPFSEWVHHPFTFFFGNLKGMTEWFITYIGWSVFLLTVLSFFLSKTYWREKILLVIWGGIPFLLLALFGKVIYPRYVLPMSLTLLPLAAYSLWHILQMGKNKIISTCIIVLVLGTYAWADYFIIADFARAPIPQSDLGQFINSWPAGGGVKESIAYFSQQAKDKKIFIGTEGTYGLLPEAVEMYLVDNPNVTIKGYWPMESTIPDDVAKISEKEPTYFIFYQPCPSCIHMDEAPPLWPLKKIAQYQKGSGPASLTLYQVLPRR